MIVKKLKCPKCNGVLEVKNPNDEETLLITCPNPECKAKIRVTFDTGETQLAQPKSKETIGFIRYLKENYPLKLGKTIIGRKLKDEKRKSPADIAIPTEDHTMSRVHAEIEVVKLENGRIKVILSDLRGKEKIDIKPTLIEDEPLSSVDRVVLCHGDIITLGETNLQYIQE